MALSRLQTLGICLLVALLAWIPFFYHLDQDAVWLWDESRVAVNALEMAESGELLVTTYEGQPDRWFPKPPLMVWLSALSMKVFGYNTLALRLPAALAASSILYMLLWFSIRVLKDWRIGLFSILTLVTIRGFVAVHVARSADVDILLVAFLSLFWIAWWTFLYGPQELRNRAIWISALGLSLAFMSKSSAALLSLPGLAIWLVVEKRLLGLLRNWRFHLAYFAALVPLSAYYLARDAADPGYLTLVWDNEFVGRFNTQSEVHDWPFGYYFEHLFRKHLFPYIYFLPLAILLVLRNVRSIPARLLLSALSIGLPVLLIISLAQTKLEWYNAQLYPLVAIIIGLATAQIWTLIQDYLRPQSKGLLAACMVLFSLAVFGQNFYYIYRENTSLDKDRNEAEAYGYAMQEINDDFPTHPPYKIAAVGYNATAFFYASKYKAEHGETFQTYNPIETPSEPNDVILICNPYASDSLDRIWNLDTLWHSDYGCQMLRLLPLPYDSLGPKKFPLLRRRDFGRKD